MNTYQYTVKLKVQVDAFDESDAQDALEDTFGLGDSLGVNVVEVEYEEARGRKNRNR